MPHGYGRRNGGDFNGSKFHTPHAGLQQRPIKIATFIKKSVAKGVEVQATIYGITRNVLLLNHSRRVEINQTSI